MTTGSDVMSSSREASGALPLDLATVESMQRKVLECYGVPTDEASGGANIGASVSGDRRR